MHHHRTMNIIIDDGPCLISESIVIDLSVLIGKIAHPPRSRTGALGLTRICIRTGPCSNYWACIIKVITMKFNNALQYYFVINITGMHLLCVSKMVTSKGLPLPFQITLLFICKCSSDTGCPDSVSKYLELTVYSIFFPSDLTTSTVHHTKCKALIT